MKLAGARARSWINSPPTDCPGVLLFGPDAGLCAERAEALAKKFSPNPDDPFSTTVLSADDLSGNPARLADEMVAQSLLGDARLIRLRLSHERNAASIAKTIKALDARPDTCAAKLIVEAGDMTPRSAIRKAFESAKNFASIACYADSQADIANMVRTMLGDLNIRIDTDALDALAPLLEGDRRMARSEVEKLALYKGYGQEEGAQVSLADIKTLIGGAGSAGLDDIVFDAMAGNMKTMDASLRRALAGKINPHSVLAALQRHIVRLHQASASIASGNSADEAMRGLRPPVFVMRKNAFGTALRIWPETALARAISQSLETEKNMKSTGAPVEALLGRLLIALSSYAARRKR